MDVAGFALCRSGQRLLDLLRDSGGNVSDLRRSLGRRMHRVRVTRMRLRRLRQHKHRGEKRHHSEQLRNSRTDRHDP